MVLRKMYSAINTKKIIITITVSSQRRSIWEKNISKHFKQSAEIHCQKPKDVLGFSYNNYLPFLFQIMYHHYFKLFQNPNSVVGASLKTLGLNMN